MKGITEDDPCWCTYPPSPEEKGMREGEREGCTHLADACRLPGILHDLLRHPPALLVLTPRVRLVPLPCLGEGFSRWGAAKVSLWLLKMDVCIIRT